MMVSREPKNHFDNYYFCFVNITGIYWNNRNRRTYSDFVSARRPVPYSKDMPIPTICQLPELCDDEYYLSDHPSHTNEGDSDYEEMTSIALTF